MKNPRLDKKGGQAKKCHFIKGDENLFHAKSRFPQNFLTGILITFGWIIVLQFLSYRFYKKSIFEIAPGDIDYNIFSGRLQKLEKRENSIKVRLVGIGEMFIDPEKLIPGKKENSEELTEEIRKLLW
ncbi:MAG: hypothetical protein KAW12_06810, partial [Candidatus Aminicenantes bacterium]|nr:hypothetical protein [Candidatus Aminicenantes bacterium]